MTTTDTTPRAFPLEGALALAEEHLRREYASPRAGLLEMLLGGSDRSYRMVGGVAVIDVHGPLDQRGDFFWDGYASILDRCRAALADEKVRAVVLALDSPGGVAAGNLDASRDLRAAASIARKPMVAHAGTIAVSAAYALAVAADRVMVTADGAVGSVGVIQMVYDRTKANSDDGLDVRVVRSGALKADPHPDVALTDASVSRVRARVMDLATSFAAWVAERREQTVEAILAHQGATIYATRALEAGLADGIGTLADAISTAAELAATQRHTMQTEQQLAAIAAALGAGSPEEALATIATMRKRAEAADVAERELATVREQLAARDAAQAAQALEAVLVKHRTRGALTPAMEADSAYLADLAPLSAEALDRVLSKLPGAPKPVTPKRPEGAQPDAGAEDLTATDREWAARFGVDPEHMQRAVKRDRERASARGLADTE